VRRAVAFALLLTTGCATIVNDTPQRIAVTSDPPGASVTARCSGAVASTGTTPGEIAIPLRSNLCSLHFEKSGYEPQTFALQRGRHGGYWGNLGFLAPLAIAVPIVLFGAEPADNEVTFGIIGALALTGVVGFVRDRKTGAAYVQEPEEVHVTLVPRH
jgi:hypothetical protein